MQKIQKILSISKSLANHKKANSCQLIKDKIQSERKNSTLIKRTLALCSLVLLMLLGCEDPVSNRGDENTWTNIEQFNNCEIQGLKVIDDYLYIYGADNSGKPLIKRTKNGTDWNDLNLNLRDSLTSSIKGIAKFNDKIVIAGDGNPLYQVDSYNSISRITPTLYDVLGSLEILNDELIVTTKNYNYLMYRISKSGKIDTIKNHINVLADGSYQNIEPTINAIHITSAFTTNYKNTNVLLIGNFLSYHFIDYISDYKNFQYYPVNGLTAFDRSFACYTINKYKDTLIAGTIGRLVKFNGTKWEIFKDLLPLINKQSLTLVLSSCVISDKVYVGADYLGVLYWDKGWKEYNEGLPKNSGGYYLSPENLITFNGSIFLSSSGVKTFYKNSKAIWKRSIY